VTNGSEVRSQSAYPIWWNQGSGQYGGECYSEMTHREKVLADNKKRCLKLKWTSQAIGLVVQW
jgi:hypothetical protein